MDIPPINRSFLSNNKFDFSLKRIPNFTFFVQSVNLPGLTLQSTQVNTPFAAVSIPGDIITFGTLSLSFIVDEDMQSWYEIYNWIFQLGNPKSFDKLGSLTQDPGKTNAILFIKSNANNPMWKITFNEIYPTDLGGIDFTTTDNQEFVTSTATFNYTYYELTPV